VQQQFVGTVWQESCGRIKGAVVMAFCNMFMKFMEG
jgi:hypothetical protein